MQSTEDNTTKEQIESGEVKQQGQDLGDVKEQESLEESEQIQQNPNEAKQYNQVSSKQWKKLGGQIMTVNMLNLKMAQKVKQMQFLMRISHTQGPLKIIQIQEMP